MGARVRLAVSMVIGLGLFGVSPLGAAAAAHHVSSARRVIVVLRHQVPRGLFAPALATKRERAFAVEQRPVLSQMAMSGARRLHAYRILNAVSGTVTPSEVARLRADPAVARVIPDQVIRISALEPSGRAIDAGSSPVQSVCAPNGGVELDPEALETIGADSDQPGARTARSLGITGAGVKVAFIADGIDVNNPDLIRPDGQPVIVDYKDFSGDGTNVPTDGGEAFLDASALSAQGREVYDISHYSAQPLSQPCNIRIEGVAPGASLVALDVAGSGGVIFTSAILQAIDYAVSVDHVQVINESFTDDPYPDDSAALDVLKQADDDAQAAGTTVVAGTGDAGPTDTEGTPATDPKIISVGASTTYRADVQSDFQPRFPGITGWLDDNIASLSSAGFALQGQTISLVAPGEDNWALCSTDVAMYADCVNFAGQPSDVQFQGGTSQSAPLTAGTAALVIQAYRETHGGVTPSPSLVKQLIVSSADDIGAPAELQGSGRLDAYRAVLAAEAYGNQGWGNANSNQQAAAPLVESATQLNATDAPGRPQQLTDTIANPGPVAQTVSLSTRALGPYRPLTSTTVDLEDSSSPQILDASGEQENYEPVSFDVPAGQNRLQASAAYLSATATTLTYPVTVTLVDPNGKLASYSDPMGESNYGEAQVTNPTPGRWTAYIRADTGSEEGTTGQVRFGVSTAQYTSFGQVSPASLTIPAGASRTVNLQVSTPAQPGDASGAIVLDASGAAGQPAAQTTIPVTLRSLIPNGHQSFVTTLTGGNGRAVSYGQTLYYQMLLPAGLPELNADIRLADNPHNPFNAFLVSPSGEAVSAATNELPTAAAPGYSDEIGAQLHAIAPAPGMWTMVIVFAPQVSGTELSEPVTITTNQSSIPIKAAALPNSPHDTLARGKPQSFDIEVSNPGTTPESYFLDGRLPNTTELSLQAQNSADTNEPLSVSDNIPTYLVPTDTSSFTAQASTTGSEPIGFNAQPSLGLPNDYSGDGDPNIESSVGLTADASLNASPVAQGLWSVVPTLTGVFGSQAASPEPVTTSMSVATRAFDPAISSPTGDLWQASTDTSLLASFAPVFVAAGQSTNIPVTITPTARRGTTVRGTLYVDDASLLAFQINPDLRGSQVIAIPYTYTVK